MKKMCSILCASIFTLGLASCSKPEANETYNLNLIKDTSVAVGTAINPMDYFTIVDSNNNTIDSSTYYCSLVSGDVNKVGTVKYIIVCGDQEFELTLNIVKKDEGNNSNNELETLLNNLMKKDYSNITLNQKFDYIETVGTTSMVTTIQEEKKIMSSSCYEITYVDYDDTKSHFYVNMVEDDRVYVYEETSENTYKNTPYTYTQWNYRDDTYGYYYGMYFLNYSAPTSFNLLPSDLTANGNVLTINADKLDLVGEKIFALNDDNAVFTSISLEFSNDAITKVVGSYNSSDDDGEFSCNIEYNYSNMGTTSFTLPDVAPTEVASPEHIDPSSASALTEEQKAALTTALSADFAQYEVDYVLSTSSEEEKEHNVVDNGKYKIDYSYENYYQSTTTNYYFEITEDNKYYAYEIDEKRNCQKTQLQTQDEITSYAPYGCSPVDFEISADSFGYVDGVYVATLSGLKTENDNFAADASTELFSLNVTLGTDNNVSKIEIILKTEDEYGTSFTQMSYTYSNIGNANVTLPKVGSTLVNLTAEQKNAFEEAIDKDYYSNVTIYDTLFGSSFFFNGDDVRAYVNDYDKTVTDYTVIDGKYYEITADGNVEIPFSHVSDSDQTSFDYFVPVVYFTSIDIDTVVFDSIRNCYYVKGENISLADFAYYFCSDYVTTLNGITFTLNEDNTIKTINIEFTSNYYGVIEGYGLEFDSIGTTVIK